MIVKRNDLSLSVEVKECGLKRSLKYLSDEIRFPRQTMIYKIYSVYRGVVNYYEESKKIYVIFNIILT